MNSAAQPPQTPGRFSLINTFVAWKLLLLALALLVPSPAYDTSASLLLQNHHDGHPTATTWLLRRLCTRLTSWDALYYTQAATHGYSNEQEWAFGWGYTKAVSLIQQFFPNRTLPTAIFSGIILSTLSHLLSTLVLYQLTLLAFPSPRAKRTAYIAACLHIVSPAGIFLSAPYSESTSALCTFFGSYLYALSLKNTTTKVKNNMLILLSGATFFLGSTVRSNGVLNGMIFLIDFIREISSLHQATNATALMNRIVRIGCLGLSGLLVGGGVVLPQFIAWKEFCGDGEREWCTRTIPSIYIFVQDHYWNVGFLRYWTLSNIPLFLLAAPMLLLLTRSGIWGAAKFSVAPKAGETSIIPRLAYPQLLLAVMALLSYHVQIITRLSSGCVVWYWWVAELVGGRSEEKKRSLLSDDKAIVRYMGMYALIQCVLYAGFLPPA